MLDIGIIREEKTPLDRRVPLTPSQCKFILEKYPDISIIVQPSPHRCYTDDEYRESGVEVNEDIESCHILLGVKEVPIGELISNKAYIIFSHTIKKQSYNRDLLRAMMNKNIRLIDWECLKDEKGQRVIAFGRWAGIVGAYNGLRTWGKRSGDYNLPPMQELKDFNEARSILGSLELNRLKIVLTGDGRVGNGACETLDTVPVEKLPAEKFLDDDSAKASYTQLSVWHMYGLPGAAAFDTQHYYSHPEKYESIFLPYTRKADVMINGIYWDERVPKFFSWEDMQSPDFRIKVIADITCDIAPESSVPSTIRASEITDPVYGYDPFENRETEAYREYSIDVMAVDNLPNELPRDASEDFGKQFINHVLPQLIKEEESVMIHNATICRHGQLNEPFEYLFNYVHENF